MSNATLQQTTNTIYFCIEHWQALCAGLSEHTDWQQWARDNQLPDVQWPQDAQVPASNLIPAMMRRRMSALSKLALQTACLLLQQSTQVDYLIFSSRHGELHRTVELLQDIINGQDASPTAFSQSVHNTSAGLFTIATKQAIPATSIAAGEHTLHSALIEAYAYLADNPHHKVLLIDFDQPLPAPYDQYEQHLPHYPGYALGMLLSGGKQYQLTWQAQTERPSQAICPLMLQRALPQSLTVLYHLAKQNSQWSIHDQRQQWNWQVND